MVLASTTELGNFNTIARYIMVKLTVGGEDFLF